MIPSVIKWDKISRGTIRFEGVVKKGAGVVVLELAEKRNLFVCRPGDRAQDRKQIRSRSVEIIVAQLHLYS